MNNYQVSITKRVKNLENLLSEELQELKNEIEESDLIFDGASKSISSSLLPKNVSYFRDERRRAISAMLNVSDAPQLKNQGKTMSEELEAALKSDITDEGLPLLLHQFFLDRVQSLVQCKHLHLLRWHRFCQDTSMIERLYDEYKQRLGEIDLEYSDAKNRASRLAAAYTAFNNGEKDCMKHVESEDIAIYLRWFVTNLRCVKKPMSYMKILEWFPLIHCNSISLKSEEEVAGKKSESTENTEFELHSDSARLPCVLTRSFSRSIDQAFTGMLSNELTSSIPLHTLDLSNFRAHLEALASEYGIPVKTDLATSADEMELFGAVNRQFKRLFNLQEECMTFYPYDFVPEGNEHWGIDSPTHSLLKQCNWPPYINILPHQGALQIKQVMQLKQSGITDELLVSHSRFLEVSDYSSVVDSLKQHASAVQQPPVVKSMQVTTHSRGKLQSVDILARIYDNPQLQRGNQDHIKSNGIPNDTAYIKGDHAEKDDYNFSDTMQLLGLDETDDTTSNDPSVVQGAYLSFLHLRILKLRDVRRQCLSLLNYFRSVERKITIYDRGLSLEGESSDFENSDSKAEKGSRGDKSRKSKTQDAQSKASRAKPRCLGTHHYINSTPLDFKVEQSEFMEFRTIENHDDFYQLEEEDSNDDGIDMEKRTRITASVKSGLNMPHVQDQRGYYIVYELAVKDFKAIESDNLLIASHFINKDQVNLFANRRDGDVDLAAYAHREVDRFAVLLDSWMCELNFLHNKRELLDCYLEAYDNTFSPQDRQAVAQVITDIIHLRPRHDLAADYFIEVYKLECACLRFKTDLMKQVLNSQIQESRQHASSSRQLHHFGLPFLPLSKQPIALNLPKPSLLHMNMFEFHPALGVTASRLTETLRLVLQDLTQTRTPNTPTEAIIIEKQLLEIAIHEWEEWSEPGTSYSAQIQKELFTGHFIEDPKLIEGTVESLLEDEPDSETREEKRLRKCNMWKTALNAVVLHHRLRDAAWETEVLSRIYKYIAKEMGYGDYHMYLRLSQLEHAAKKPKADPPPSSLTRFIPDESAADRFLPNHLSLAIQELDEVHLPLFSFYKKKSFTAILTNQSILENILVALASQVVHRNSLIVAALQAVTCMQWKEPNLVVALDENEALHAVSDSNGSAQSVSSAPSLSSVPYMRSTRRNAALSPPMYSSKLGFGSEESNSMGEPFISIQFEKAGPRDLMINEFIKKKETSGVLLQKESEVVKLKRQLVINFCKEYSFRTGLHAMRAQIAACYSGILSLLENLPKIRDMYFVMGRPNEKKRKLDDVEGMIPDAKTFHRRPRRVLSSGGTDLLNLWFIPHYTEILFSFRNKDYPTQHNILVCWLEIASSLHDILQCLCAHARLGKSLTYDVTADWGGTEGVAAELAEIQKQIESLSNGTTAHTKSPVQAAELLKLRKDVMFLEFDASVRQYMRHLFLECGNQSAYDGVTAGMRFALLALSSVRQPSIFQVFMRVPEPLHAHEESAKRLFPWLSFEGASGEFPLMYRTRWRDVESCMQLCLASLNDSERQLANGQILGTSMLFHDILLGGAHQLRALQEPMEDPKNGFIAANPLGNTNHASKPISAKPREGVSVARDEPAEQASTSLLHLKADESKSLSKTRQPITSYKLIKTFFLLCKQVEILKEHWLQKKMSVEKIDTSNLHHEAERIYFSEIYFPVLQSIARDMGLTEYYTDVVSWENTIHPPPQAPEIAIRARQLSKLLESIECLMIQDVRHRVSREFSLVLAERSREEAALPTDLWKRPSIKETFTVNRPTIVEDFLHELMNDYNEEDGKITFTTDHLNKCVFNLSATVMKREKQNYETYSNFYENILHHHHQLLYQKERELRAVLNKSSSKAFGSETQAQFQLADYSQQLILEITGLRSALTELKEKSQRQDRLVRQQVQAEHQELVRKLFEECFQMKAKLSQYHLSLHGNMHTLVSEARRESMGMLENLRSKSLNSTANERLIILQAKDEQVKKAEMKNANLNIMLRKLLAFNHWRKSASSTRNRIKFQELTADLSKCKKELQMLHLASSQNQTLLEEQLQCARKALDSSEHRLSKLYDRLERQQRARLEKEYKEAKEEKNRRELAEVQKKNLDQIVAELKEKDKRLMVVSLDNSKTAKASEAASKKVRRKVKNIQTQLETDRMLKLEAFDRVDDLQAHVWDYEQMQRGGAGSISLSRPTSAALSHAKSSLGIHGFQHDSHSTVISVNTPPYTPRFKTRPLSSIPAYFTGASEDSALKQRRPKTSSSLKYRNEASGTVGRMALGEIFAKQKQ